MRTSAASQLSLWAESTPSSAASRANRTASPASARGERTSATCGPSSHAWCERFDPVGCSVRTSLASALQRQTKCSLIWKRQVTPAGRSWWVLTTSERRTDESGCGLSPDWRTPHGLDNEGNPRRNGPTGCELGRQVTRAWPTATREDARQSGAAAYSTESGRHSGTTLTDAAAGLWATASARDWRSGLASSTTHERNSRTLNEQVCQDAGLLAQGSHSTSGKSRDWPTARSERYGAPDSHGKAPIRGVLNSRWVAQLMGYPSDWCDLPADTIERLSRRPATASSRRSSASSAKRSSKRKRS